MTASLKAFIIKLTESVKNEIGDFVKNFLSLPTEKQKLVRDSALHVFGQNIYRKASIRDIALEAGISKSLVFHYFDSKKSLYLYLVDYCSQFLSNSLVKDKSSLPDDYFERMILATEQQMHWLKKEPFILPFLTQMLMETDPEVMQELMDYRVKAAAFQNDFAFRDVDLSRFKENVDPNTVLKIIIFMAEGFSKNISLHDDEKFQRNIDDFKDCLATLKKSFYREEFL